MALNLGTSFRGRRVLVTGHTGFKGSWLALWLADLGAEVFGLSLPQSDPQSHFNRCRLSKHLDHREGDIRDIELVRTTFRETRPEIVFHLAAQALVRRSYMDPKPTFDTNIGGTINVLDAIRESSTVRAAVMITSDKCYDNYSNERVYREEDPLGGHDPYSASKGAAELVIAAYRRSFLARRGIGLASARAGNVIGGGDYAEDRIVPDCVRALLAGTPIKVRNPFSVRPWQHVLEPVVGYLQLGARLLEDPAECAEAFNFAPDPSDHVAVDDVVKTFVEAWGSGSAVHVIDPAAVHEARALRLSHEKATRVLGWRPVLGVRAAIRWSADWYRNAKEGGDMIVLSREQIRRYVELVERQAAGVPMPGASDDHD